MNEDFFQLGAIASPSLNGHVPEREPELEPEAESDDNVEVKQLHVLTLWDMFNKKPPPPLVHELLDKDALTFFVGAEGSGKSFWAIALACAIAAPTGMNTWEGHRIYEHGPVLYIAAEGASGMGNRIKVWCEANNIDPEILSGNMNFIEDSIPLEDPDYRDLLMREVEAMQPLLIVIDTKSAMTASVDENSANEQSMIINFMKRLKRVCGSCILIIHHKGKSGDQRGSNVWPTNCDDYLIVKPLEEEYEPEADRPFVIFCQKHKERPDKCSHEFLLKTVRDEFGKPRSRVILQPQINPNQPVNQDRGVQYETVALELLRAGGPLTRTTWVSLIREETGAARGTAYRVTDRLIERPDVVSDGKDPEKFKVERRRDT